MPKRVMTEYRREYVRISMIRSRIRLKMRCIAYKGGKCAHCGCGEGLPPDIFEFHHPDPSSKDFGISESSHTKNFTKLLSELDKVILLCCRCHRIVHHQWNKEKMEARMAAFAALPNPERGRPRLQPCGLEPTPRVKAPVVAQPLIRTLPKPPDALPISGKGERVCYNCGNPTDQKKFCSQTCYHLGREKATWPSDEELHKRLWERPATKVAEELGVSSVAVKKRCKLRSIPTPPRGYWAKTLKVSPS